MDRKAAYRSSSAIPGSARVPDVEPLEVRLRAQLLPFRIGTVLFTLFGALALAVAAAGLFGVLSYFVAERGPELGIRRSLGANRGDVVRLVVRQGMVPVVIGLLAGLGVAVAGGRLLEPMLFGVSGRDPLILAGVPAFLLLVALLASWLPARRAVRVDPMSALRAD